MMSPFRVSWSVVCLVLSAVPYIASDEGDVCAKVPGTACSCVFPNGTGIDLTPASSIPYFQAKTFSDPGPDENRTVTMHTFYYHPCKDFQIDVKDKPKNFLCDVPVAICKHNVEMAFLLNATTSTYKVTVNVNSYENFGVTSKSTFSSDGRSLIYENRPSATTVLLQCAPLTTEDTLYADDREPNAVIMTLYSKNACLREIQAVSHRSLGSTLLIIFFTMLMFYIILGVCTKKFLMGAQGLEVIPNLSFWMDLPSLCREGWQFARNGCRAPARRGGAAAGSPDPNSYDSI